jgi:hypothetical protein
MVRLNDMILAQDDPFEFVYEGISGTHGVETMKYLTEMYSDVVIDCGLHPDDDFEKIIDKMIDIMEDA